MFTYDYLIVRDEGTRTSKFTPKSYPKELPNLSVLQGPNSSGKSALLNIIALGLYGHKQGHVEEALKWKIQQLRANPYQKLTFSFTIKSGDGKLSLTCEKKDGSKPDVTVTQVENGKSQLLTPDSLQTRYQLIYDVPTNPTSRIMNVVEDAIQVQQSYYGYVNRLRTHLETILEEIHQSLNPEAVSQLTQKLADGETAIRGLKDRVGGMNERLTQIEILQAIRNIDRQRELLRISQQRLDALGSRKRTAERTVRRHDNRMGTLLDSVRTKVDEIRTCQTDVLERLRPYVRGSAKKTLEAWEDFDPDSIVRECGVPLILPPLVASVRGIATAITDETAKQKAEEARVYRELLLFLERYREINIDLPGAGVPLKTIIEALREKCEGFAEIERQSALVDIVLDKLKTIDQDIDGLRRPLFELSQAGEAGQKEEGATSDDSDLIQNKIEEYTRKRDEAQRTVRQWEAVLVSKEVSLDDVEAKRAEILRREDLAQYANASEHDLDREITGLKTLVRTTNETTRAREIDNELSRNQLESLTKKKPHELRGRESDLDKLLEASKSMEIALRQTFADMASKIRKPDPSQWEDESHRKYSLAIGHYLANRIRVLRHVDAEYDIASVDVVHRLVESTKGVRIHFDDMGTGQGQSAYLQTLLSHDDRRRMIVLIDEVAMMDARSSKPIYDRLKQLEASGRLLLGLIVQKAEEPAVLPLDS